jgi:hypothetical protein
MRPHAALLALPFYLLNMLGLLRFRLACLLALPQLLGGCTVASVSSLLPPTSPNPFAEAPGTKWELPRAAVRRADTPPSFGPYQVSNLHRGWLSTRTTLYPALPPATGVAVLDMLRRPYLERTRISKGRSRYHFADDQGRAADIFTTTEGLSREQMLSPNLGVGPPPTEQFSAILVGAQVEQSAAWYLELPQPPPSLRPADPTAVAGRVGDDARVLLTLQRLPHPPLTLRNGRRVPWPVVDRPGGIAVLYQQQRIGYIDYATAQPSVWLRDDISADLRFLTAACLSAVLLRNGW